LSKYTVQKNRNRQIFPARSFSGQFKGIVSPDWKGLQMVSLDLTFKGFYIKFTFNVNVVFTMNFLKMAPISVRFSPGFLSGAGFHGEDFAPACL
jgi:hypothetical protein